MSSTTTIVLENRNSVGTLTDVTTVTLDNGSGIAITRDSDGATILLTSDPRSVVVHPSTGVYSFDYSILSLDPSQAYTVHFKVLIGAVVAYQDEQIQAADVSRTLLGYRRALAEKLGMYGLYTTTGAGTDPTTQNFSVVCDALADVDRNDTAFNGSYVYMTTGALRGQQRRIRKNGYDNGTGTLLTNRAFPSTPPIGTAFEIHSRMPAIAQDNVAGLREIINQALRSCWHIDRLSFDGVSNLRHYDISAYPWLQRQEQIGPIYGPASDSSDNPPRWPGGARMRYDAETPVIELSNAFTTGDTWFLDVIRFDHTYIRSNGSWGESTVGLVDDDDAALCEPQLLVQVALAYAYQSIAAVCSPQERDYWMDLYVRQARRAAMLKGRVLPGFDNAGGGSTSAYGWGKGLFATGV